MTFRLKPIQKALKAIYEYWMNETALKSVFYIIYTSHGFEARGRRNFF